MKKVTIYTDGACSGNPGKGGWAAVLTYNGHEKEIFGSAEETTNNKMELRAVIEGLAALKEPCEVEIYSDSQYVVSGVNEWLTAWIANGWTGSNKKAVKNCEMWKELNELLNVHKVVFHKVAGHTDNEMNNRCDKLAVAQYKCKQPNTIIYKNGNLLESDCDIICHQVNCCGVMGAGIALQIRGKYPKVYHEYINAYEDKTKTLGDILPVSVKDGKTVINMYSQLNYGGKGVRHTDYKAFEQCLQKIKDFIGDRNATIGFPDHIGCGLAGGDWETVKGLIEKEFKDTDYCVKIYKK